MLQLATSNFTLSRTHSAERVEWRETWQVGEQDLTLIASAVKGSGAGMEPGPQARLSDGWWVSPGGMTVERLALAASGETGGGWTLCSGLSCRVIGTTSGSPMILSTCGSGATDLR